MQVTVYLVIVLGSLSFVVGEESSGSENQLWTEVDHGYEGLVKIPVHDRTECFMQCFYLEHCNIISFDDSKMHCFIQVNSEVKEVPSKPNLKTFHNKRDALNSGQLCWKKFPGKVTQGYVKITFEPLPRCMLFCIGIKICNAITYDSATTPSCWVQLSEETAFVDEGSFESSDTADSFQLDKDCLIEPLNLPK